MSEKFFGGEKEKNEYRRKILKAFEKGIEDEGSVIGYHGTSLEAVKVLLETGKMPGYTGRDDNFMKRGDLNFYPLKSKLQDHSLKETFLDKEETLKKTASYAESVSESHYLLKSLEIEIDDKNCEEAARLLCSPFLEEDEEREMRQRFLGRGINEKELDEAIEKASGKNGVIITISDNILGRYEILPGDQGEGDLKINFSNGFSVDYIEGIKPIGKENINFFEELKDLN
jgi:hypothetical protein